MRPGRSVVSPRLIVSAPAGWETDEPTSAMRSPWTRISPGEMIFPDSMSRRRAAWRMIALAGPCDWAREAEGSKNDRRQEAKRQGSKEQGKDKLQNANLCRLEASPILCFL